MKFYSIKDKNWNSTDPEQVVVRWHYAAEDVLEVVLADIAATGYEVIVEENNYLGKPLGNVIHFDYGGMVCQDWRPIDFEVRGLVLGFYAHHLDQMYQMLHHALDNQGDLSFCRIYSYRYVFCTTRETVQEFLDAVKASEETIRAREKQEFDDYEKVLKRLNKDRLRVLPIPPATRGPSN